MTITIRCLPKVFTIAFIVNRPFFIKYHSLSTYYNVTLATKTDFSHLIYPTSFWVYIRLNSFFDNYFSTKFQHPRVRYSHWRYTKKKLNK